MKKIKIKSVMQYGGHAIKSKGVVTVTLKANYDELVNVMQMCQFLHQSFKISVKMPSRSPLVVGDDLRLDMIKINKDGFSDVKITGITDFIELDTLNMLVNEENTIFLFVGEVDTDNEDDEEEE